MTPQDLAQVQQLIQAALAQQKSELTSAIQQAIKDYDSAPIKSHQHNGFDSQKVDGSDLMGFDVGTAVPTQIDEDGRVRLYYDKTNSKYYLYIRMNKGWRKVELT